jgi:hypothetical protein
MFQTHVKKSLMYCCFKLQLNKVEVCLTEIYICLVPSTVASFLSVL